MTLACTATTELSRGIAQVVEVHSDHGSQRPKPIPPPSANHPMKTVYICRWNRATPKRGTLQASLLVCSGGVDSLDDGNLRVEERQSPR